MSLEGGQQFLQQIGMIRGDSADTGKTRLADKIIHTNIKIGSLQHEKHPQSLVP